MCWKDIYILNTQDVLVNVGDSAEFNEDNSTPTRRQSNGDA